MDSAVKDKGAGDGWFKLFDHGYDSSTERWCTDEIIDNNGLLSVNLPKGLEGGYYLARPEILALHAANSGDPQFYTGCAQIFLESTGNLVPEETVSIPGYVKYGQPATSFDIYNTDNAEYTVPGPAVANLTSSGAQSGSEAQTSQTEGLKPEGCICENSNWCGKEVPSYSTESGCWDASEDCWAQSKVCWASTLPTGGSGCEIWAAKCTGIQDQCNAGNFNGPPNKGKVLTPKKSAIDVGPIMATVGGGIVDSTPKTSAAKTEEAKTETPAKPTPAKPTAAKPTSTEAAAPKPTANDSYDAEPETDKESDDEEESDSDSESPAPAGSAAYGAPAPTITTAPSSAAAPEPTAAPQVCPKGWKCVTEVETVTKTVYVTAADDSYKKRAAVHRRRHAHRA